MLNPIESEAETRSSSRAEAVTTDSDFQWTLRRFGLIFAPVAAASSSPSDVRLDSREFRTRNGADPERPHRWLLRACCLRLCPEAMIRVNVSLVNLNEERVAGRYALRSYFKGDRRGEAAAELVSNGKDGGSDDIDRRDLMEISPKSSSPSPFWLFVGWSGRHTEYSSVVVRAHIRTLHLDGDSTIVCCTRMPALVPNVVPVGVTLDDRLTAFVSLLYLKLTENIRQQLESNRQQQAVDCRDQGCQTDEDETSTDWELVCRRVLAGVVEAVRRCQKQRIMMAEERERPMVTCLGRQTRV